MIKILANDGIDANGKKILEAAGFTVDTNKIPQEELATKAGMQRANIARIESGKHRPYLETLEKIAEALNKPVAYFAAR